MLKTQTNHWYSYFPRAEREWYAIFGPLMWFSKAEDVGKMPGPPGIAVVRNPGAVNKKQLEGWINLK